MSLCSASLTLTPLAVHFLWQSPNSPNSSCCNPCKNVSQLNFKKHSLFDLNIFLTVLSVLFHFLSSRHVRLGLGLWGCLGQSVPDPRLRGIRCLSRMTQQEGGPPNSKWREVRMGANGSSYPHSCSPRIGGNTHAQQTFIGRYFICGLIKSVVMVAQLKQSELWWMILYFQLANKWNISFSLSSSLLTWIVKTVFYPLWHTSYKHNGGLAWPNSHLRLD